MSDQIRTMIAAAIAAGQITRLPAGATSKQRDVKLAAPARINPTQCGPGARIDRHRFLDEMDGDWS